MFFGGRYPERRHFLYPVLPAGIFGADGGFWFYANQCRYAEDLSKGLIDRFRSLPMAASGFLTGRVIADGIRYALLIVLMIGVGQRRGFRFENGLLPAIVAILLVILFGIR